MPVGNITVDWLAVSENLDESWRNPRVSLIDLLRRNSRFGYSLIGDMNAQIAACRTGEERLKAIIARSGLDAVRATKAEVARQSAQLDREAIAAIPDGSYEAEGYLDNDGVGDEPGLKSVATATGVPAAMHRRASSGG